MILLQRSTKRLGKFQAFLMLLKFTNLYIGKLFDPYDFKLKNSFSSIVCGVGVSLQLVHNGFVGAQKGIRQLCCAVGIVACYKRGVAASYAIGHAELGAFRREIEYNN